MHIVSCIQNKNYQVDKLHQKHYKSSFLIIVIYHYLSFVTQLSLHVAVQNRTFKNMCYSHSHDVIPIPIPIPINSPKAIAITMGFPRESRSHGNSHCHAHLYSGSELLAKFNGYFLVQGYICDKIFMKIRSLSPEI